MPTGGLKYWGSICPHPAYDVPGLVAGRGVAGDVHHHRLGGGGGQRIADSRDLQSCGPREEQVEPGVSDGAHPSGSAVLPCHARRPRNRTGRRRRPLGQQPATRLRADDTRPHGTQLHRHQIVSRRRGSVSGRRRGLGLVVRGPAKEALNARWPRTSARTVAPRHGDSRTFRGIFGGGSRIAGRYARARQSHALPVRVSRRCRRCPFRPCPRPVARLSRSLRPCRSLRRLPIQGPARAAAGNRPCTAPRYRTGQSSRSRNRPKHRRCWRTDRRPGWERFRPTSRSTETTSSPPHIGPWPCIDLRTTRFRGSCAAAATQSAWQLVEAQEDLACAAHIAAQDCARVRPLAPPVDDPPDPEAPDHPGRNSRPPTLWYRPSRRTCRRRRGRHRTRYCKR